jgi:hypothetical protein
MDPQEGFTTLIEHWDGASWQIVPSPNGADGNGELEAIAVASANDIWAVGASLHVQGAPPLANLSITDRTLIEHWDGKIWSVVPSPNNVSITSLTSPTSNGRLNTVSVVSADNVWAAGQAISAADNMTYVTLIEHWDGTSWRVVPGVGNSTAGIDGSIIALQAIAANDIWAVGGIQQNKQNNGVERGLLQHWDGTRWKVFPSSFNSGAFIRLSAISSRDIWAAGNNSMGHEQLIHWDGRQWSLAPGPQLLATSQVLVSGVASIAPTDVWIVGWLIQSSSQSQLVFHWDGKVWQQMQTPALLLGAMPREITVSARDQVWIVGQGDKGSSDLIEGQRTCP